MTKQEWIDGAFTETDTDYKISDVWILDKNEEDYLVKGVELLCDELNPTSVLEFGFGKGWTATEFQRKGVTRHVILEPNKENYQMALTWKNDYSTDIEILNIFSWEYEGGETFNLVYDDRMEVIDENAHKTQMDKILETGQWYAGWAAPRGDERALGYPIHFELDSNRYTQDLFKYGESL
jgi:hypothetical protein